MATEKIIDIKLNYEQSKRGLKEINSELLEQKDILILLEEEYLKAKQALDAYNASNTKNLAQEKQLKEALQERKAALEDQRLGIRKIQQEQRVANDAYKNYNKLTNENSEIVRGIDKLTGGYATKILKLKKGFLSGANAIKNFVKGLSGIKKALIATGVGALVVGLATVIAYWDEITALFDDGSRALQKQADEQRENVKLADEQLALLNQQEKILELQGKSTEDIVAEKKKVLILQAEENEALLKTLKLQLEKQKAQVKEVSFLDKIKIAAFQTAGAYGKMAEATAVALGGTEEELQRIKELEDEIQQAKLKSGKIEISLLEIDKKKKDRRKKEAKEREKDNEKELREIERQNKKRLEAEKKYQENLKKLKDRIRDAEAITEEEQRARELEKMKQEHKELMAQALANGLLSQELIQSLRERENNLKQSFKDEDDAKREEERQEQRDFEQMELDARYAFEDAKMGAMQAGVGILKQFAKDNKALSAALLVVEKGLAIAQVITNASRAIAQAKANLAATPAVIGVAPNPAYPIQVAATAKGIASAKISAATSIATIAAQAIPGLSGGGGGASAGSLGGGGGTESQAPSFNIVGASETNQLAQTIGEQIQQPVQAYVVANDVTTAQSLENNIVDGATLQ